MKASKFSDASRSGDEIACLRIPGHEINQQALRLFVHELFRFCEKLRHLYNCNQRGFHILL